MTVTVLRCINPYCQQALNGSHTISCEYSGRVTWADCRGSSVPYTCECGSKPGRPHIVGADSPCKIPTLVTGPAQEAAA